MDLLAASSCTVPSPQTHRQAPLRGQSGLWEQTAWNLASQGKLQTSTLLPLVSGKTLSFRLADLGPCCLPVHSHYMLARAECPVVTAD